MQKNFDLVHNLLAKLQRAGVLDSIILIGSWCSLFYENYFSHQKYIPFIKTTDIDFLVPTPSKLHGKIDVAELLKDDGFGVRHSNSGFIILVHKELTIEFLVPDRGKGLKVPYPLPQFGLNAQPLRYLDFLAQNTMSVESHGIKVTVPHPAAYGIHKLIVSERRMSEEKMVKDRDSGLFVLRALIKKGESDTIKRMFNSMIPSWQKKVLDTLNKYNEQDVIRILKNDVQNKLSHIPTQDVHHSRGRH